MFTTPVLIIIFNRPELTACLLDNLQAVQPKQLYVAADGPRKNNPTDVALCEQTRGLIKLKVNWDCEVKTLYRDVNLGCGKAVSSAITWFFSHNEYGIILEDDCLPNLSFYHFCEALLIKYKDNEEIMHIGGTNFQNGILRGEGSYYFSSIIHVWGWASWRRAWSVYDFYISELEEFIAQKKAAKYTTDKTIIAYWERVFFQMQKFEIDTWDHQWTYTIWKKGGLAIIPQKNLVANTGFGADATHTHVNSPLAKMPTFLIDKIIHPEAIVQNRHADNYTFYKNYYHTTATNLLQRILTRFKEVFR